MKTFGTKNAGIGSVQYRDCELSIADGVPFYFNQRTMTILPDTYTSLPEYTDELCQFLETPLVRQITGGIHVNDALIYDAWGALPSEWTSWWESLPDHRLAQRDLIDNIDERKTRVSAGKITTDNEPQGLPNRPPSLTKWLKMLHSISLPRVQDCDLPELSLPEALTSFMKTKKIAEVSAAAAYIQSTCQANSITHIIDIGSGQGYLPLVLTSMFPSLRVLAIDASESQVAGSMAVAVSLGISEDRLQHLVRYVDGAAETAAEMAAWADGEKCMLVGLHACGRLSEHMLRYFTNLPFITSVAVVGCCYNHILPYSSSYPDGFPISRKLKEKDVVLSATALMTGCQAPNNWPRTSLSEPESSYSRRHFYRALLEKIFFDKGLGSGFGERPAWGIRKGDLSSFVAFTTRAVECLGIDKQKISKDEMFQYEERYRNYEGRIAILWTLSVLCCKVVESVIAMDRYWFLVEQGAEKANIVPIFDYNISPRNLMMVAEKKTG